MKLLTCMFFRNELNDLLTNCSSFWNLTDISGSDLKKSLYEKHVSLYRAIRVVQYSALLTILAIVSSPIVFTRSLPMGTYNYGGSQEFRSFCCLMHQICILCVYFYVPALDMVFIGACATLGTQFEIAGNFLKKINHSGGMGDEGMVDVKQFVEYHNRLFKYVLRTFISTIGGCNFLGA